ncbi:MAG: hypothetical protein NZ704_15310, partial [Geminicoccaceae bacterium]|nr:hypothetical protein [Geminicoccaceae bacterium]
MPLEPLDVGDPHGGPGELAGIVVDLDAEHLPRADLAAPQLLSEPELLGLDQDPPFQILHGLKREIEEIVRAAGGVEHAEPA